MKLNGRGDVRVLAVLVAALTLAPSAAFADFTGLTSPDQINATPFSFDGFGGPVTAETNAALTAAGAGFIFPNAGEGGGEFIVDTGDDFVLDVLGGLFGYDGLVEFQFDSPVEAFGIEYRTSTQLFLLAFDADGDPINPEGTIVTPFGSTDGFFGITSADGIVNVLIHDDLGSFQLLNMIAGDLATTPLPGSWVLGIIGFGLVGFIRARGKT